VHIQSRSNALLVRVRRLLDDPAAYRKHQQIVIEGEHLCAAWVDSGRGPVVQAIVSEAGWERADLRELAAPAAAVAVVPAAAMAGLAALDSPPPILFVVPLPERHPAAPACRASSSTGCRTPGTWAASCAARRRFGFGQAIALKGTAALWSPKVVRAGMGAHFRLHLVEGADAAMLPPLGLPLLAPARTVASASTAPTCRGLAPGYSATRGRASPPASRTSVRRCSASPSRAARSRST
jgi:TrmH family RNA methyltransferase